MRINGNLVFNTDASGEIQNVFIERHIGALPTVNHSQQKGRIIFSVDNSAYYFSDGSAWVALATGGNAAALQTEVDNIETSIGAIVNGTGTWNGTTALEGVPVISGATSITNALTLLANEVVGTDALAELVDVNLGVLSNGQVLRYNGTSSK